MLKAKEGFITDLMLDVYRYTDAHQILEMKLKDADRQKVDSRKQIQDLSSELQGFKDAAKLVVGMVDSVTGKAEGEKSLLQRLQEVPQKFSAYVTDTTKSYVFSL